MKVVVIPPAWRTRALVLSGVENPESYFDESALAIVRSFKLEKRRREWMLSRIAAKQLGPAKYVSFSHSAPYAAAARAERPIGIDIQTLRDFSENAAHLFLSDSETAAMQRCAIPHRALHFWCAKEAAWKMQSDRYDTLRKVPLTLIEESEDGLRFDVVETWRGPDFVLALTLECGGLPPL